MKPFSTNPLETPHSTSNQTDLTILRHKKKGKRINIIILFQLPLINYPLMTCLLCFGKSIHSYVYINASYSWKEISIFDCLVCTVSQKAMEIVGKLQKQFVEYSTSLYREVSFSFLITVFNGISNQDLLITFFNLPIIGNYWNVWKKIQLGFVNFINLTFFSWFLAFGKKKKGLFRWTVFTAAKTARWEQPRFCMWSCFTFLWGFWEASE